MNDLNIWEVYAEYSNSPNKILATFKTKEEAEHFLNTDRRAVTSQYRDRWSWGKCYVRCNWEKVANKLNEDNERLQEQIKLMDEKARVAFNHFWNGGWYEQIPPNH